MPKCERCNRSVRSIDLRNVDSGGRITTMCLDCCNDAYVLNCPDDKMLLSVSLHQYETADDKQDYYIKLNGSIGGLTVGYRVTFEELRNFFSPPKKEKSASLSLVP